jgi:hypothetical protein
MVGTRHSPRCHCVARRGEPDRDAGHHRNHRIWALVSRDRRFSSLGRTRSGPMIRTPPALHETRPSGGLRRSFLDSSEVLLAAGWPLANR